jgi:TPR repeat protein
MKRVVLVLFALNFIVQRLPAREIPGGLEAALKYARSGDPGPQANLGIWYYEEGNYKEASKWLQLASQKGHARAQYNLAILYKSGLGFDYDITRAAEWFEKSAIQGFAPAQFNLGSLYLWGKGVEKNPKSAQEWLLKAARQGHREALTSLGSLYFRGDFLKKNWVRSFASYSLAKARGAPRVNQWLLRLEKKITETELRLARRMAQGDFRDFRWGMDLKLITSGSERVFLKMKSEGDLKVLEIETELNSSTYEMRLYFKEDKLSKIILSAGRSDAEKEYKEILSTLSRLLNDPGEPVSELEENTDRETQWTLPGLFTDTQLRLQQTRTHHFFSLFLSHSIQLIYSPLVQ